jgi:hypothetical protein
MASRTKVAFALVVAAILLLITGALAISDLPIFENGGLSDATPSVSPVAAPTQARGPIVIQGPVVVKTPVPVTGAPGTEPPGTEPPVTEPPEEDSPYTCEDREVTDLSSSRWQLRSVLAGARRGFERATFELERLGHANRPARITFEWMSPEDARDTFGLPRFDGQRGVLVTFGAQVTMTGTQLIGPVDLRSGGLDSISGVYRFVDFDGQVRTYIALRDRACARIRAPELDDEDSTSRRATILVDLAVP